MKTAEEILMQYTPYIGTEGVTYENILKAMEAYASQRDTEPKEEGKGAEEWFDNHFDCYADKDDGRDSVSIPAMTKETFLTYASLPAKQSVTDEDIEKYFKQWTNPRIKTADEQYEKWLNQYLDELIDSAIEGAKAYRDGQIPKK